MIIKVMSKVMLMLAIRFYLAKTVVGCWAHARRKYMDVIKALGKNEPNEVEHEIIELITKLYAIKSLAVKEILTNQLPKRRRHRPA